MRWHFCDDVPDLSDRLANAFESRVNLARRQIALQRLAIPPLQRQAMSEPCSCREVVPVEVNRPAVVLQCRRVIAAQVVRQPALVVGLGEDGIAANEFVQLADQPWLWPDLESPDDLIERLLRRGPARAKPD